MDVVAMVKSYDDDVVDVGSQTGHEEWDPIAKGGLLFTLPTATRVRVLQVYP